MNIRPAFSSLCAVIAVSSILLPGAPVSAQRRLQDRITREIGNSSTIVIRGNVHPMATARNDMGRANASLKMQRMTMVFKSTDQQQSDLTALLEQQQDPGSLNYHRWLTPDEFANRFGLSQNDVDKIVGWLQSQGLTVDQVGSSRRSVTFSGSALQVERAFNTSVHQYMVNGRLHYANSTEPSVPDALANVVVGFRLNDFRMRAKAVKRSVDPQFTSEISGNHYIAPNDFATIYDVAPLYAIGLDGTGQKIAVVGQTDIQLSDIRAFRLASGLPANDPQVILVPGSSDPGISPNDLTEADLDIEWAGAVAPKAQIIYVNAFSAIDSLQYAVEQNVAPVISVSYGDCERNFAGELQMFTSLGQQANAQGTTIVSASGDNGAADCDAFNATIATQGLAVDMPASLPYVTAMGGTEFQDSASDWSATNNASSGSALAYISEIVWNDSNSSGLAASGGGKSKYFTKPSWQTGAGVPNDSARDVPDISFNASAEHDGYLICSGGGCVNGYRNTNTTLDVVGGTSAATPSFAGVVALINQSTGSSQGNLNPNLYRIAAAVPTAYHDITVGGNQVACRIGSPDCTTGVLGYAAGPGYDQVTGLGTVDAAVLLTAWSPALPTTTPPPGSTGNTTGGTTTSGSTSGSTTSTTPVSSGPPAPQPISVVEQGSIQSGYVTITPDSGSASPTPTVTYGIVNNAVVVSQAGVTPTNMMTDGSLYADVIPSIGRNLGVALANLNANGNSVTLMLRDANGNALANPVTIALAPQQQMARFVSELFPSAALGSSFLGSLRVQSSSPLGILGLRFNGAQFSTLPVAVNAAPSSNGSFVLPQFAMGGGWATQVALVNNTGSAITGMIRIYDTSGNPLAVTLNGSTQSSFSYSIPAGGTFVLAPRDANGQSPF